MPMKGWEYKTVELAAEMTFLGGKVDPAKLDALLNDLGRQGWELVSAFDTNWGYGATRFVLAIFKRPTPG
jgi:hypothetical protein